MGYPEGTRPEKTIGESAGGVPNERRRASERGLNTPVERAALLEISFISEDAVARSATCERSELLEDTVKPMEYRASERWKILNQVTRNGETMARRPLGRPSEQNGGRRLKPTII